MGSRYISYYDCARCNGANSVEEYDAPSSLLFSAVCSVCNWKDSRDYYQELCFFRGDYLLDYDFPSYSVKLHLLSQKDATKLGFCIDCGTKPCQCENK